MRRALDVLDIAVVVLASDLRTKLYANAAAATLLTDGVPPTVCDAVDSYVVARGNSRRLPPAVRVDVGAHAYYLRVVPSPGPTSLEVVFLRQEVLRDVDVLRMLEERFQITRREYQVVTALRLGKTNRQIAADFGLAEGTVARHVHRLLERMNAHNRTELVHLVDELVKHTG